MECSVPWQRFEPSRCILGIKQQNRKNANADYLGLSYKDSFVDLPVLHILTPWLGPPVVQLQGSQLELSWSLQDHAFFNKMRCFAEQLRVQLQSQYHMKLNGSSNIFTIVLDKDLITQLPSLETTEITKLLSKHQQYKFCIRFSGVHASKGVAQYRFKCIGAYYK